MNTLAIRSYLLSHPHLEFRSGLFYQTKMPASPFEDHYIKLRKDEGRLYDDNTVKKLPHIETENPLYREWQIRKSSADRLVNYIHTNRINNVVEIGCGNGWLLNYLNERCKGEYLGIDINQTELLQASRVFGSSEKLNFALADVNTGIFNEPLAHLVVLASVIQYFPDLAQLISKLKGFLRPGGEIHVLDSPFYNNEKGAAEAKDRTKKYFDDRKSPDMAFHYHHHTFESLHPHHFRIHRKPGFLKKIFRLGTPESPFDWIIIPK
jgi:SAM-dependent methyltransferase